MVTFENDIVNAAIEHGIEEVANIIVQENETELARFSRVRKAGGTQAYIEQLMAEVNIEVK